MTDVYIKLSELEQVVTQLEAIITEFDNATSLSEELEKDIGDPFGESKLREEAQEFEERWDDKRGDLKDGLKGVKDHVDAVIKGVEDWDSETAIQLTGG
ncbi:flagellar protein FlgN [Nocardioides glacieisoli]|jgi:Asp-tRNA(Asn)/Glu-tRNA(Gln) amidotransferase C subunit|uniref:Flagellar protein FlgN n=1 Tax=Nocardioides glacieisoli TaxID=1168730 RepID=A0A4Q2S4F2_9ACTN|nr:flagellar protein FlgN [Nocardioides glacieisoli]RYB96641.1 flagellar protein FlgN [Nocardioides glacieisoli]